VQEPYRYPPVEADRIDPLDGEGDGETAPYLIFGWRRTSYAFADPDKDYGGHLVQWIPMGYMVLRHAQKVAVYRDGERVREWPVPQGETLVEPPRSTSSDPCIDALLSRSAASHAAWQRTACGYLVMTPSVPDRKPHDPYDRAEALAMTAVASRTEGLAALWYVYRAENWH
jgi:hypothetical protein